MCKSLTFAALFIGLVIGAVGGWFVSWKQTQLAVLAGPFSDNYGTALNALAEAKAKLKSGDTDVIEHLEVAKKQLQAAQSWSARFIGFSAEDAR